MFRLACESYLNNLNRFISNTPKTGLAIHLKKKMVGLNSTTFWNDLHDWVKPAFLSDKEQILDLDDFIMKMQYYRKETALFIRDYPGADPLTFDWITWYVRLSPDRVKSVDHWYETR